MKTLVFLCSLFVTTMVHAQEAQSTRTAAELILEQEHRALDEWSKGNPLGYLAVQADDITYFDDIGASDLVDGKSAMRSYLETLVGKIGPHSYEIVNPKIQLYDDIGILTMHYKAELPDGTLAPMWKATSVYHKADGEWRIVHANWSLVKSGSGS